jgi:putative transcriptional regulator
VNEELFNELVESVREGGAILRGEVEPSRTFVVDEPDLDQDSHMNLMADWD